jgi:hypothetical protein
MHGGAYIRKGAIGPAGNPSEVRLDEALAQVRNAVAVVFEAQARVAVRRESLASQSAPLDHNGHGSAFDATPERLARAHSQGLGAPQTEAYGDDGAIQYRRRKIERPLETALRFRWISPEQKRAGDEFARYMILARAQLGYGTSQLRDRVDGGGAFADAMERKMFYQGQLRRALASIQPPKWRQPYMNWMALAEQDDASIKQLGASVTHRAHSEAHQAVGEMVLAVVLDDLAVHFGIVSAPGAWDTRRQLDALLAKNNENPS